MPLSPDDPFMLALEAYQAQEFEEAARHCRKALESKPENPACLHLMGMLEFCSGHWDEAEQLMRRALSLRSGFAEVHYSFAQVLAVQGKQTEALEHYQKTLALKPDHAAALFGQGNAHAHLGQIDESAASYEQALWIKPDYPEALNNLSVYYSDKGDYEKAIDLQKQAIDLRPNYAAAHNNLGNAYKEQKKWAKSIDCYRRAFELNPSLYQAINNLGLVLMYGLMDLHGARLCFQEVLEKYPDDPAALTHLGITLCMEGHFDEGLACYEKALAASPFYNDALNNMGNALKALGRLAESINFYIRVEAKRPDDPEIHNNLAMAYLAVGRFDEGWAEYEWRWKTAHLKDAARSFTQPLWRGEEGDGRTLLIYAEQGFGDTLQFCRYAHLAAARGWKVILEAQSELVSLLSSLQGVENIYPRSASLPTFDAQCPMMSLPRAFHTQVETIPANVPYLFADEKKSAAWREKLKNDGDGLRVGLVWSGNPKLFSLDLATSNKRRSLQPETLAPLADLEGVQFYSLQKGGFALTGGLDMLDYINDCADFSDTAALMDNLDLVISVDTSVAHLAGAMGKQVWLLNRFDSCWRWMRNRDDTPWYPSMRIFNQPRSGDWESVIRHVRSKLEKLTALGNNVGSSLVKREGRGL